MGKPLRVLVVEDSDIDCRLLLRELARGGYSPEFERVETAESMEAALETRQWDVILSDHSMPVFSAPAALGVLRRAGFDLPFIIVSGSIGEEAAVEVMRAGAHDYVTKDKMARLVPAVERELGEAEVRRARRRAEEELHRLNEELELRVVERTAQLEAANRQLAKENAQTTALLQSLGEAVEIVDGEGRPLVRNQVAMEIRGLSSWDALESPETAAFTVRNPDGSEMPREELPISRVLRGESFTDYPLLYEWGDGTRRWLLFSGSSVREADGKVSLGILVFRDVTELRQMEQTREDYVRALSHDLRNPLTAIQGNAQLLRRLLERSGLSEMESTAIDSIYTSSQRMNAMLRDLSEVARLEAGQLRMEPAPVELRSFMNSMKERLVEPNQLDRIRLELPEDLPLVSSDSGCLERILGNLLSNAIKYAEPGTPITVSASSLAGQVVVSVSDRGPGIPADELAHIFDRYYRTRAVRSSQSGLGLGLYITKGLVEGHGGRIWVESQPGNGSCFSFTLPAHGGAAGQ
jgi:PAS domain S-box-containing protein